MRDPEIWRFPALQELKSAWLKAKTESSRLPTLAQLADHGAPDSHPGMGLVAQKYSGSPARKTRTFHFLLAGPDFQTYGGHVAAGHSLNEIMTSAHAARLTELYEGLCDTGSMHIWRCINAVPNAPVMSYTRIVVPIHDDQGDGRCLYGIWIWHE